MAGLTYSDCVNRWVRIEIVTSSNALASRPLKFGESNAIEQRQNYTHENIIIKAPK